MTPTVYTKEYTLPPYNISEILRYSGSANDDAETTALAKECILHFEKIITPRVCFCEFEISVDRDVIDLGFTNVKSRGLAKNLEGCQSIVLFAATIGIGADNEVRRYQHTDIARAVVAQAIGAERIEALCDAFCSDICQIKSTKHKFTRPRYSPGYGDLPLALQADIVRTLDCRRKIGMSLSDSLLMTPTKSVTAIVGISDSEKCTQKKTGCGNCSKTDCEFRK